MATQPEALVLSTGQRINWLMDAQGVKPGQLAKEIGIDPSTLWSYRRGVHDTPGQVLVRIADALHTTTDFLLCRTDDPRPLTPSGGPRPTREKVRRTVMGDALLPRPAMPALSGMLRVA